VRELQSDSDIDDVKGRIVVEEKRRRTSATKCEWNSFVRFQFDNKDDDEGKTVAAETTSVTALLTRWVRS
jgi:hypothetical protein